MTHTLAERVRPRAGLLAILALLAAACTAQEGQVSAGSAADVAPVDLSRPPSPDELRVTCGPHLSLPVPVRLEDFPAASAEDAERLRVDRPEPDTPPPPQLDWRDASSAIPPHAESEGYRIFLAYAAPQGRPELTSPILRLLYTDGSVAADGTWKRRTHSLCSEVSAPGWSAMRFVLDPSEPPDPRRSTVTVYASEIGCSGGRIVDADDIVALELGPDHLPESSLPGLLLLTPAPEGDAFACPGAPATRATIDLRSPLRAGAVLDAYDPVPRVRFFPPGSDDAAGFSLTSTPQDAAPGWSHEDWRQCTANVVQRTDTSPTWGLAASAEMAVVGTVARVGEERWTSADGGYVLRCSVPGSSSPVRYRTVTIAVEDVLWGEDPAAGVVDVFVPTGGWDRGPYPEAAVGERIVWPLHRWATERAGAGHLDVLRGWVSYQMFVGDDGVASDRALPGEPLRRMAEADLVAGLRWARANPDQARTLDWQEDPPR